MSKNTFIQPQRRKFGSKHWIACKPHQAQRFAICRGRNATVISAWPSAAIANKMLASMTRSAAAVAADKPLVLNQRYGTPTRPIIARSLTQAEYAATRQAEGNQSA